jgi:hypothetical protein
MTDDAEDVLADVRQMAEESLATVRADLEAVVAEMVPLQERERCLRDAIAKFERAVEILSGDPLTEAERRGARQTVAPRRGSKVAVVACPLEGCDQPHRRPRHGLVLHLTNGHRSGGKFLARRYKRELMVYAERIAAGDQLPKLVITDDGTLLRPKEPAVPEPAVLRTLPPEEQGVIENHCGECGEFESECTCDDDATVPPAEPEPSDPNVLPMGDVDHGDEVGPLRCIAREPDDDRHQCGFTTDDPDQLVRHMRRRHPGWANADDDDLAEAVCDAQRTAGIPATYRLGVA